MTLTEQSSILSRENQRTYNKLYEQNLETNLTLYNQGEIQTTSILFSVTDGLNILKRKNQREYNKFHNDIPEANLRLYNQREI